MDPATQPTSRFRVTMPAEDSSVAMARAFAAGLAGTLGVEEAKRDDLKLAFAEAARWAASGRAGDISIGVTTTPDSVIVEVEPVVAGDDPDEVDPLDILSAVAERIVLEKPVLRFEMALT